MNAAKRIKLHPYNLRGGQQVPHPNSSFTLSLPDCEPRGFTHC
jgi:hypothetical protein